MVRYGWDEVSDRVYDLTECAPTEIGESNGDDDWVAITKHRIATPAGETEVTELRANRGELAFEGDFADETAAEAAFACLAISLGYEWEWEEEDRVAIAKHKAEYRHLKAGD